MHTLVKVPETARSAALGNCTKMTSWSSATAYCHTVIPEHIAFKHYKRSVAIQDYAVAAIKPKSKQNGNKNENDAAELSSSALAQFVHAQVFDLPSASNSAVETS